MKYVVYYYQSWNGFIPTPSPYKYVAISENDDKPLQEILKTDGSPDWKKFKENQLPANRCSLITLLNHYKHDDINNPVYIKVYTEEEFVQEFFDVLVKL